MKNKVGGIVVAKICGEHTCSQCGTMIAWEYHIPNKLSSGQCEVEDFISSKHHPVRVNSVSSSTIALRITCSNCGQPDEFICTPCNSRNAE